MTVSPSALGEEKKGSLAQLEINSHLTDISIHNTHRHQKIEEVGMEKSEEFCHLCCSMLDVKNYPRKKNTSPALEQ